MTPNNLTRRDFLAATGAAALSATALNATSPAPGRAEMPLGRAESCIMLWLGGGACHVDMWDPKRRSTGRTDPGSYYDSIPTAVQGVRVCEHLTRCADLLDRMVLVRTVNHPIDEHAAAVNRMHTGRPTTGTILYPSLGSVVARQRGQMHERIPAYVLIGYPNVARGPGFLGSQYSCVYLTETAAGPNGLTPPPGINAAQQARRQALLQQMQQQQLQQHSNAQALIDYVNVSQQGFQLAGPDFMRAFQLQDEPAALRQGYGNEFGQRCLLARRLVETGVRFVEVSFNLNFVNGTGWDTHNDGQINQHLLIQELDQALAALITDLERVNKLDSTLIVVSTEFGRPPEFDSGGGRGHQPRGFSVVLAGGGLRTGRVIGQTDDLGRNVVQNPVSVPDLHATIYAALGINPAANLFTPENRPVPITDGGQPIAELFPQE